MRTFGAAATIKDRAWLVGFKLMARFNEMASRFQLDYERQPIRMVATNVREYNTRLLSCAKEPEMVEWIESWASQLPAGSGFMDVGANVGAYSLIAAANRFKVVSIEPSYANYNRLCENARINNMSQNILSLPVALSSSNKIANFKFLEVLAGSSRCYYNEKNAYHLKGAINFESQVMVYRLDDLIAQFNLPIPSLLKIDVDGGELDVVSGATNLLKAPELRSAMIEIGHSLINPDDILQVMDTSGFKVVGKFFRDAETDNYRFERK